MKLLPFDGRGILVILCLCHILHCAHSRQVKRVSAVPSINQDGVTVTVLGSVPDESPALITTGVEQLNPVQTQVQNTEVVQSKPVEKVDKHKGTQIKEEEPSTQEEKQESPKPAKKKAPKAEEISKEKEHETPKAEEKPTKEKHETPKAEEKPTEEKHETPKAEEKPTKKNNETPKAEEKPTKENNETPKAEEKPKEEEHEAEIVEEKGEEHGEASTSKTTTSTIVETILSKVSGRKICESSHCLNVAKSIKDSLNTSVDPCENFYEYACGNWIKDHEIPDSRIQYSRISELSENNRNLLLESLKTDQITDTENLKKVKLFYRSCMDNSSIEDRGSKPLKDYIKELGSWSFEKEWSSDKWDFNSTLQKMHRRYSADVLMTVEVHEDPTAKDEAKYIVLIDQAPTTLPQIVYLISPKTVKLVKKYMTGIIALTMNCSEESVQEQVDDIVKFEAKLAFISVPSFAKKYVLVSLEKLEKALPEFPWLDHLRSVFWPKNITMDTKVIVQANHYLPKMFDLLKNTNTSTLSNYMVWRQVKEVIPLLSKDFRDKHFSLKKSLMGVKHDKPREKKCFGYANSLLGPLMGALFVKNAFSPESKHKVETMMEGIIKAFKNNIEHVDWVDNKTVIAVEEKADEAEYKIGYPEYLWDEKKFDEKYKTLNITEGNWFDNVLETFKFSSRQTLQKLDTVSDNSQWITVPHLVNAFYIITRNEIVIPSGILQPPFFYPEEIPRSLSYGAIGHVIGHELTHGFDPSGRRFDKDGERINSKNNKTLTWSDSSIEKFENRSKCLVDQFSNYTINGKLHMDGAKTLGEAIADGGGVKLAYYAFRDFIETHTNEEILPLLNMPHEQLFFLGYAQKECVHTSRKAEFLTVMRDVHPLSKYRVIGTLSNMEDFSKVYKCKKGAKMNPKKKCEVW